MPLTPEQQAQLEALQAAAVAPPHRTRTGVAGVLHALIETVSGAVAHRSPDEWLSMAETVEDALGTPEGGGQPAEAPAEAPAG
jgi:hypothetical protein